MILPTVVEYNNEAKRASQEEVDRNKFGPESKAFSDNVPYLPEKKINPPKKPIRGLSSPSSTSSPKKAPVTPSSGNASQTYP